MEITPFWETNYKPAPRMIAIANGKWIRGESSLEMRAPLIEYDDVSAELKTEALGREVYFCHAGQEFKVNNVLYRENKVGRLFAIISHQTVPEPQA